VLLAQVSRLGEQPEAIQPVSVRESARGHHDLVGAKARGEFGQQSADRGRITDDVRPGRLRDD